MKCTCSSRLRCIETRARQDGATIRRYKCLKCDARYTTLEQVAESTGKGNVLLPQTVVDFNLLRNELCAAVVKTIGEFNPGKEHKPTFSKENL